MRKKKKKKEERKSRTQRSENEKEKEEKEEMVQVWDPVEISQQSRYFSCSPYREHMHTAAPGGPCAGAGVYALKELWPVESLHWSKLILKDCSPWEGPTLKQEKV